ncbi:MAG: hypothetical protein LBR98_03640 [Syntrophomonadaceae bacterium]|jgi:hypothetical protein|nr:hypothetical protein [Syntrophomonadaceae bacterium]
MNKAIIVSFFVVLTVAIVFSEEMQFKATRTTPYELAGTVGKIRFLDEGEVIVCKNMASYFYMTTQDSKAVVLFVRDGNEYWAEAEYLIPVNTRDVFSSDIAINHNRKDDELWVPAYYADVLGRKDRDILVEFESFWLPYQDESADGSKIFYWHGDYKLDWGEMQIHNSVIISNGKNLDTSGFIIKNITKTEYGYRVTCIESVDNKHDCGVRYNWSFVKDQGQEYFDLLLYIDGDYIDLYVNDTSQKFGTIMKVGKEFATQFESLIKTNTCDLTNVVWPRRADGSMDYPPPQPTQAAATEQPEVVNIADYEEAAGPGPVEETVGRQQATTEFSGVIVLAIIAGIVVIGGITAFVVLRKKR